MTIYQGKVTLMRAKRVKSHQRSERKFYAPMNVSVDVVKAWNCAATMIKMLIFIIHQKCTPFLIEFVSYTIAMKVDVVIHLCIETRSWPVIFWNRHKYLCFYHETGADIQKLFWNLWILQISEWAKKFSNFRVPKFISDILRFRVVGRGTGAIGSIREFKAFSFTRKSKSAVWSRLNEKKKALNEIFKGIEFFHGCLKYVALFFGDENNFLWMSSYSIFYNIVAYLWQQ